MRVTNNTITRNYLDSLHRNYAMLNKYSQQVMTGQRFSNVSEDPSSAIRAMQVRRSMARIDGYVSNANAANTRLKSAEDNLTQVNAIVKDVSDRWIQAINGDKAPEDLEAIRQQLVAVRDELLSIANNKYSDKYLFGGNNTATQPFTLDDAGDLYYNGQKVADMTRNDPLFDEKSFIEIGMGINFDGMSDPTAVNPSSGFNISLPGINWMGVGKDNLYLMIDEMICMIDDGIPDKDEAGDLLNRFNAGCAKANLEMTRIGAETSYLSNSIRRLEDLRISLTERQEVLELKDADAAIIDWKVQEYVYNAALQMGQRLLQPTLFNYIS